MTKEIPEHLQYNLDLMLTCEKLLEHARPRLTGDSWERQAERIYSDLRRNRRALPSAIQRHLKARNNRCSSGTDASLFLMILCPPTLIFLIPMMLWESHTQTRCDRAEAALTSLLATSDELYQATTAVILHLEDDLGDTEWQAIWQEFAPSRPSAARSPQIA